MKTSLTSTFLCLLWVEGTAEGFYAEDAEGKRAREEHSEEVRTYDSTTMLSFPKSNQDPFKREPPFRNYCNPGKIKQSYF